MEDKRRRDAAIIGLATALLLAAPLALLPPSSWPSSFHDDAFYYAQVARHILETYFAKLDGRPLPPAPKPEEMRLDFSDSAGDSGPREYPDPPAMPADDQGPAELPREIASLEQRPAVAGPAATGVAR